jgi:two-component system CheB/CheR fusion protein
MRIAKDGRRIPVLLTLSLLTDDERRPVGLATIAKDVTTLKAAEESAREGVRRRDEFLALLSHELRNPLSAVLNSSRLITRSLDDRDALTDAAAAIDRQGWHMARLLDDLLDVSRVTSGKIQLRREVVDLRDIVNDTVHSMREVCDERFQELVISLPEEPVLVEGDSARLYQIVENLLSNACKYTPEQGRVELIVDLRPMAEDAGEREYGSDAGRDRAVLCVRDNGVGIEKELLPHVFDMFTQSERTLARSGGGMGVGLTLVRNLVELHGGTITAHSDGPHRGSQFEVLLPLTTKQQASKPGKASGSTEPRRVLIVEDNADARRSLAILLRLEGHQVAEAPDGEAGLSAMVQSPPDVALVDIGLPRLDGYQLARRARENPALDNTLLVAVTGYGQDSDRRAILEAGFDEHLVKPISADQIADVLAHPVRS